jgi:hypothetical protein
MRDTDEIAKLYAWRLRSPGILFCVFVGVVGSTLWGEAREHSAHDQKRNKSGYAGAIVGDPLLLFLVLRQVLMMGAVG